MQLGKTEGANFQVLSAESLTSVTTIVRRLNLKQCKVPSIDIYAPNSITEENNTGRDLQESDGPTLLANIVFNVPFCFEAESH